MKRELNKYLDSLSEKELIQEVKKLYDKFEPVRQYYTMELSADSEKVLTDFKARIKKEKIEVLPKPFFLDSNSSSIQQDWQ